MRNKALSALRVLVGLIAFTVGNGQSGGFGLVLQQIESIGPRQWLNLMAGTIVGAAPISDQIARVLPQRLIALRGHGTTA